MSDQFPEKPLLLYPSLAQKLGVEQALLLGIIQTLAEFTGITNEQGTELLIQPKRWQQLAPFWSVEQVQSLLNDLAAQRVLSFTRRVGGSVAISLHNTPPQSVESAQPQEPHSLSQAASSPAKEALQALQAEPDSEELVRSQPSRFTTQTATQADVAPTPQRGRPQAVSQLPVYDEPPVQPNPMQSLSKPQASGNLMQQRGPAPTFGGSTGWSNKWRRNKDELEDIFAKAEHNHQKMTKMDLEWKPSAMFYELLPKYGIEAEFANGCLDEFALYNIDKDRKASNWDQKFLAWVKRAWTSKQTQDSRNQQYQNERSNGAAGALNENSRPDSRAKRKQITDVVMDIKDTDW